MRIKSIEINNYRQYKNLSFSFDKKKDKEHDLHIIVASNGVGKSNFLNAITWCLYEDESHLQDKYKALPIVNLDTIKQTANKDEIKVSVEIKIDVDGDEQTIRREATFIKNELDEKLVMQKDSELSIQLMLPDLLLGYSKLDYMYGEDATMMINRLFPENINEYFFFDNEQMNNYFKNNKSGAIQSAINEISKVSLLNDAEYRIQQAASEYRRSLGSNNTTIDLLTKHAEEIKEKYDSEQKELKEIEKQTNDTKIELEGVKEIIAGAENLKEIEAQRNQNIQIRDDINNDLAEINNEINSFIVRYTTLINMYPSFMKAAELIKEKDKKKQLPPDIKVEAFEKSKENDVCELCGRKLDPDSIEHIQKELKRLQSSNPANELLFEIKGKVYELIEETKMYTQLRDNLLAKRQKKKDRLDEVEATIEKLNKSLKSIPNKEEILENIDKRDALEKNIDNLNRKYGYCFNQIESLKKDLQLAEQKVNDAINAQARNDISTKKYNLANKLHKYLEDAENEIIEEIRNEISKETYENFINLIWKKNTYTQINIDENYNVDLIQKDGLSAIGSTSAAERALLALSFTNAIHNVSGFDSPLVIDSPVGRVSDVNRQKFAESLAKISENKQIIMMFTPDEYSDDVSNVFDDIANKSIAKMNGNEDVTSIKGAK